MSAINEPENKRRTSHRRVLQSAEPDLTIVVGSDDDKQVYHYHSVIMAQHSKVIDTMLKNPMMESNTMTISFPEIDPEYWEKMMDFIEDPVKTLTKPTNIDHASYFAETFNKYEFVLGLELCDKILVDEVEAMPVDENKSDHVIFLMGTADKCGLKNSYQYCLQYFGHLMRCSPRMLSLQELERLAPHVAKEPLLLEHAHATKNEVRSILWPKYFHARAREEQL